MSRLTEFFIDDEGFYSCMRLMCVLVDFVVLGTWAWCNIRSGIYTPLGVTDAGLICTSHTCKWLQSKAEYGGGQ